MVYLYQVMSTQAAKSELGALNGEVGAMSTITDLNGEYKFADLEEATYRIVPKTSYIEFFPKETYLPAGNFAPEITVSSSLLPSGPQCTTTSYASLISKVDQAARGVMLLGDRLARYYELRAKRGQSPELQARFQRARARLMQIYTIILRTSEGIPNVDVRCESQAQCAENSLSPQTQQYQRLLSVLRHLSLYIIRRARLAQLDDQAPDWDRLSSEVRRAHRRALNQLEALPDTVRACGVDSG
jgi:hypothetical protein